MLLRRAVHFLCLSCAKTLHASRRVVEQILQNPGNGEPPPVPTSAPSTSAPSNSASNSAAMTSLNTAETTFHRTMRITLCDPDQCPAEDTGRAPSFGNGILCNYCVTLTGHTYQYLLRLVIACKKHLPAGRVLREIRGGTGRGGEDVMLSDNQEIEAWLLETRDVHPLRVLAILRGIKSRPRPVVVSIHRSCLTGAVVANMSIWRLLQTCSLYQCVRCPPRPPTPTHSLSFPPGLEY